MILGRFGALPEAVTFIPINNPGPPIDQGDAIFGISRNWTDGLQPGNQFVPNFKTRYEKAMRLSAQAEADFAIGTPPVTLQRQLDAKMQAALTAVNQNYKWDVLCTAQNDVFKNCRSPGQVSRLKSALQDVERTLKGYDQLELTMLRADPAWRNDYIAPGTYVPTTSSSSSSSSISPSSGKPLWPKLLMFGVPAAVLLIGGAVILLKKPKPKAVAGYRRRRRRR